MTSPIKFNPIDIINRLNQRTVYDDKTGCWLYIRAKSSGGYGHLKIEDKLYYVHRLSAHIFLGLDLTDRSQHALHKLICVNKNCWNWNHLYIGDNCDNMNDHKKKKQQRKQKVINKCPSLVSAKET